VRNNPLRHVDPDGRDYHMCDAYGRNCADLTDDQYKRWRSDFEGRVGADDKTYAFNEDGTETFVGTRGWFNGDAVRQIDNAMGLLNFFVVNQSINMAAEGLGAWVAGLGAGAASRAAFQGGIRLQGAVGERIAGAQLALKGYRIIGRHVRVLTTAGDRVVDFIVERGGEYTAIEVKTGGAPRDALQLAKDAVMATEGSLVKNPPEASARNSAGRP
jgi:hypothetical protein